MHTFLITGGTGLVGKALSLHLVSKGHQVIVLTRTLPKESKQGSVQFALWDVKNQTIDLQALQKADYIIHLAGAGVVDKKWTDAYKKEIVSSRTESSALIVDSLSKNSNKVKAIVSASAIGWYGEDQKAGLAFTEDDPADAGFLGETCELWEQSIERATSLGIRVCMLRTGIVLSNDGGALAEFKKPVKLGVAGILGNGKQIVSWIHITDLCRMYEHAITDEKLRGPYNAVAPTPVSNEHLTLQLAKLVKGNFFIPMHVPVFVLKLMMGARSTEVLKSTTVSCTKMQQTGFTFLYPGIESALQNLANEPAKKD